MNFIPPIYEERLKGLMDSMLEGCQVVDSQFRYIYINEAVAKQGKKTPEEFLGHTMMELYPGIENTEIFHKISECMQNGVSSKVENEFQFPDGEKRWFELRMQKVPEGVFILSIDITDNKNKNSEDYHTQVRYQRILENLQEMVHIIDAQANIKYVTPSVEKFLGYTPDEFVKINANDYVHPDDLQSALSKLQEAMQQEGKATDPIEFRVRHKNGEYKSIEVTGVNLLHVPEIAGIVITSRDVSTRHKIEERYHKIMEQSLDLIYIMDDAFNVSFVTPSVKNILGYETDEFMKLRPEDVVFPEDMHTVSEAMRQIVTSSGQLIGPFEERIKHKNGTWHWMEIIAKNLMNISPINGIVITVRDITQKKQAENELTLRNKELEKLNHLMVGRELRMVELKEENSRLKNKG